MQDPIDRDAPIRQPPPIRLTRRERAVLAAVRELGDSTAARPPTLKALAVRSGVKFHTVPGCLLRLNSWGLIDWPPAPGAMGPRWRRKGQREEAA
jgi:hypothetical protein